MPMLLYLLFCVVKLILGVMEYNISSNARDVLAFRSWFMHWSARIMVSEMTFYLQYGVFSFYYIQEKT